MEVKDLLAAKDRLEDDISNYMAARINRFKEESGVNVRNISILLNFVQTYGQKDTELGFVSTDVKLDI